VYADAGLQEASFHQAISFIGGPEKASQRASSSLPVKKTSGNKVTVHERGEDI